MSKVHYIHIHILIRLQPWKFISDWKIVLALSFYRVKEIVMLQSEGIKFSVFSQLQYHASYNSMPCT